MKPRLIVTHDGRPAGVRVILANARGKILYNRTRDRTKKRDRRRTTASGHKRGDDEE